jgi:hypothetical protein
MVEAGMGHKVQKILEHPVRHLLMEPWRRYRGQWAQVQNINAAADDKKSKSFFVIKNLYKNQVNHIMIMGKKYLKCYCFFKMFTM